MSRKLKLECKKCEHEFDASYYEGSPASYWEPGDPEELELPEECPNCHTLLFEEDYIEKARGLCEPPED
jgi:rubredoxin